MIAVRPACPKQGKPEKRLHASGRARQRTNYRDVHYACRLVVGSIGRCAHNLVVSQLKVFGVRVASERRAVAGVFGFEYERLTDAYLHLDGRLTG